MPVPAIAKILTVFVAILALTRAKVPLGGVLVLGGVALGSWAGHDAAAVAMDLGRALVKPDLWLFLLITALVVEFGRFMTGERNAEALLGAIRRWGGRHGRAWSLMAAPAVIGLVPMPAGALFSAPLVQQAADGPGWRGEWKAAVNYWFRHTWEYWWPLYPGIIVAMKLFGMETWRFIAAQILFTPVAMAAGWFFLIRPHVAQLAGEESGGGGFHSRRALFVVLPILLVVTCAVLLPAGLKPVWPAMDSQIRTMLAMILGLVIGLVLIMWDERASEKKSAFREILSRRSLSVLFAVAGILIYKSMLDASGLLPLASRELVERRIPVVLVVAALPMLAGLTTGLAVGFTGTAFPLVVGLLNAGAGGLTPMATLVLAYGFGYTGMMFSPIHLCLVVSREYFSASPGRFYRLVAPQMLTVLAFSIVMHAVFRVLGL